MIYLLSKIIYTKNCGIDGGDVKGPILGISSSSSVIPKVATRGLRAGGDRCGLDQPCFSHGDTRAEVRAGPLQYEPCNVVRSKGCSVALMSTSLQDVKSLQQMLFLSRIYRDLSRFIKAILFDTSRNVILDKGLPPRIKLTALMAMKACALIATFGLTSISL